MKKISTLIALALMGGSSFGQTITATDLPQIGDSQYFTACDTTGVTTGGSGSGAVWNYASLVPSGTNFTINYLDPAGHAQAGNYPNANFLESPTNQQYRFMASTADSVVLEGEKSTANTAIIYDRKATLYIFPMSLGYMQTDSVHGTYPDGFFSSVDRLGKYTVEVDGTGSLTTPYATYPNVFRIKTEGSHFDSSWTGAADAVVATSRYEWYSVGTTTPVMVMTFTTITINAGAPQIGRDVWYADIPSSVDGGLANFQLTVAPSMVEGPVQISYTLDAATETTVTVMNSLGAVVERITSDNPSAGVHTHQLDMAGKASGIYFVRLETSAGSQVKKFIVK